MNHTGPWWGINPPDFELPWIGDFPTYPSYPGLVYTYPRTITTDATDHSWYQESREEIEKYKRAAKIAQATKKESSTEKAEPKPKGEWRDKCFSMDIPGFGPEDVELQIEDNKWLLVRVNGVQEKFEIPAKLNPEPWKAEVKYGVLIVWFEKRKPQIKTITVC